jgi:hypothetical protein
MHISSLQGPMEDAESQSYLTVLTSLIFIEI